MSETTEMVFKIVVTAERSREFATAAITATSRAQLLSAHEIIVSFIDGLRDKGLHVTSATVDSNRDKAVVPSK